MSSQIIRVPALLTELDVPAPSASLYLRRNAGDTAYEWASAGVSDHGGMGGLSDDDHTQYALLAGRSGGQTLVGDTASGGGLTLTSTSHATKGPITFNGVASLSAAGSFLIPTLQGYWLTNTSYGMWLSSSKVTLVANGNNVLQAGINDVTATVPYVAPAGSAAAPAFTFTGDTDTGFYRSTADRIGVSLGGVAWHTLGAAFASFMNQTTFSTNVAATVPVIVRGAAAQTANLQEWQDSAGTVLASVNASGLMLSTGGITLAGTNSAILYNSTGAAIKLSGGGTLTIQDGSSQTLATFTHNAGGTLRNAGTTRIEWNATGISFFGVPPVARPTALTAADAGALNTGDAGSDTVIGNMRTRIGELESKLQALGLLT